MPRCRLLAFLWALLSAASPQPAAVDTAAKPKPPPVDSTALKPATPRYRIVRPYAPPSAEERQVAISRGRSKANFGSRDGVQPGSIFEAVNGGLVIGLVQVDSVAQDTSWVRLVKLENILDPAAPYPLDRDCELQPKFVVLETVYFAGDTLDLSPVMDERLRHMASFILAFPDAPLLLEGHSDSKGKKPELLKLSLQRAERLKAYLHDFCRIPLSRIYTKGYGDSLPIAANTTEAGRRQNRRVEVLLVDKVEAPPDTAAQKPGTGAKKK